MRRHLATTGSALVLAGALVLYGWAPAATPPGFFVDEASIVLNAACVDAAGRDEYGVRLPLSFRSFGDYKPPALTYLQAALFAGVGPGLMAARWLSMALGLAAVAALLAWARAQSPVARHLPFLAVAAATCVLSPWLMVIARFPVECTLVPLLMALHLMVAQRLLGSPGLGWAALDGVVVGLGVYVYHSTRVLPPAHFALLAGLALWRHDRGLARRTAVALAVAAVVMLPLLLDLVGERHSLARYGGIGGRFHVVTSARLFLAQFNPVFWFLQGDRNLRHHSGFAGELNLVFLPLVIAGAVACVRRARAGEPFALYVLLLGPICFLPASVKDEGVPHALRTNVALVPLWVVAFYGYLLVERSLPSLRPWWRRVAVVLVAAALAEGVAGAVYYHTVYPARSESAWIPGPAIAAVRANPRRVPVTDHSPGTVFDRLYRVVDAHDLRYCGVRSSSPADGWR